MFAASRGIESNGLVSSIASWVLHPQVLSDQASWSATCSCLRTVAIGPPTIDEDVFGAIRSPHDPYCAPGRTCFCGDQSTILMIDQVLLEWSTRQACQHLPVVVIYVIVCHVDSWWLMRLSCSMLHTTTASVQLGCSFHLGNDFKITISAIILAM